MSDKIDLTNVGHVPADAGEIVDAISTQAAQAALIATADDSLVIDPANLRPFNTLTAQDKPVVPIPDDWRLDVTYPQFTEKKCYICNSPLRDLVEHVYIESGKKPQEVIRFFAKHYQARLKYSQIATHMESHCDMSRIAIDPWSHYARREEEIARWRYRERELALTALLVELGDVRSIDCRKNNELKLKRAAMVERITQRLLQLQKERDDAASAVIDWWDVMRRLHDRMPNDAAKKIVRDEIANLHEALRGRA